jgi:hypothetical protein
MDLGMILNIAELALEILKRHQQGSGAISGSEDVAALVRIYQAADAAYQAQTGQPLDPSLIHPEPPV